MKIDITKHSAEKHNLSLDAVKPLCKKVTRFYCDLLLRLPFLFFFRYVSHKHLKSREPRKSIKFQCLDNSKKGNKVCWLSKLHFFQRRCQKHSLNMFWEKMHSHTSILMLKVEAHYRQLSLSPFQKQSFRKKI